MNRGMDRWIDINSKDCVARQGSKNYYLVSIQILINLIKTGLSGKFWRKYVKWKLKHEENTNNDSQDFHQTLENYLPSDLH